MADIKKTEERRKKELEKQKKIRRDKRSKNICIYGNCNRKIEPVLVYSQNCPKHKPIKQKQEESV